MNTPTHLAVAVALLGRRTQPQNTKWIIWGALLPDLPMYALFAFDKLRGVPMQEIWDSRYFQDYWQIPLNIVNSIPLYLLLILIGIFTKSRGLTLLACAALIHIGLDLPLHREDAHAHFWPFSDYKFISPVSYWDPDHHGIIVSIIEALILITASLYGARVFVHQWTKWLFLIVTLIAPAFLVLAFLTRYFLFS